MRRYQPKPRKTINRLARVRPQHARRLARKLPWSRMSAADRAAAIAALKGATHA